MLIDNGHMLGIPEGKRREMENMYQTVFHCLYKRLLRIMQEPDMQQALPAPLRLRYINTQVHYTILLVEHPEPFGWWFVAEVYTGTRQTTFKLCAGQGARPSDTDFEEWDWHVRRAKYGYGSGRDTLFWMLYKDGKQWATEYAFHYDFRHPLMSVLTKAEVQELE